MGKRRSERSQRGQGAHEIRIPGNILDQIKNKEERGDYDAGDCRFGIVSGRKRKMGEKALSRKEKRQREREAKKQKRGKRFTGEIAVEGKNSKVDEFDEVAEVGEDYEVDEVDKVDEVNLHGEDGEEGEEDAEEVLRQLKAAKERRLVKKMGKNGQDESGLRIVKQDELDDDSFDGFDFDEGEEDEEGQEYEGSDIDEEELETDLEEEENPLEKLRALKEAKNGGLKQLQEVKSKAKPKLKAKPEKKEVRMVDPRQTELMQKEEREMEYYARKLGLKDGKRSQLKKAGDDDVIGGLLDGLDLEFDSGGQLEGEDEDENSGEYNHSRAHPNNNDDEDDFDEEEEEGEDIDDLDEDDLRELREMEELESGSEDDFDTNESGDDLAPKPRENPYVAPVSAASEVEASTDGALQKYIPPALRKKLAMQNDSDSENLAIIQRSVKGPLNKLSEANIGSVVNEINSLYLSHPRHLVSETVTTTILDSVLQQIRLLDTFVYLHAALVVAIYRLQGVEFGALFIQTLVERFQEYSEKKDKSKESLNIISLLSSVYTFQLISSKLIYDVVRLLLGNLNETSAELLLKLIRVSGTQMRSDDPSALKDIVLLMNQVSARTPSDKMTPRTQFLIETVSSLKNNKLKMTNEATHQLTVKLKKVIAGLSSKTGDPIQVTLADIQNVNSKGKWWLVGSAWKGNEPSHQTSENLNKQAISDILDHSEPNWHELARAQRMNTDIRRAIFISIMSAEDFIDALTKLDKLALKKAQVKEISRILIHCTSVEPTWNPYYAFLGSKLCESHSHRKALQFILWDLMKELEGSNDVDEEDGFAGLLTQDDEDEKMKKIFNLGRFYGHLFADGSLSLHILKAVNFLTASSDTILFLELALITFIDKVVKKSQKNPVGTGLTGSTIGRQSHEQSFDKKLITERIMKANEQNSLLQGLQYFMEKRVRKSDFLTGKKQRERVGWGCDVACDVISDLSSFKENDV